MADGGQVAATGVREAARFILLQFPALNRAVCEKKPWTAQRSLI